MTKREIHLTKDEVGSLLQGVVPESVKLRLDPRNHRTKRCEACDGHSGNASANCRHCGASFGLEPRTWQRSVHRR
ncbi:hypothetical protein J2J97_32335 (plasmid) [Rhizobium bangladeshense]|uniref:hypothetical protein n=1 Tax=Rhizobium bangladeshense TaxID=1138189 RepID=UPI001A989168|nr:hypothetical protein [Rhizobium bangladeshense]QSY98594.1 hypothetical protein J2J97_32335 [Rhizobium bangladeshense]